MQAVRQRREERGLHGAVAGGENHHVALQLLAAAVEVMLNAQAMAVFLARQRRHRAGRQEMRPGFFTQHFEAVVHGAVNRQQGLGGDPVGRHLLLVQHLPTGLFTQRGEAVHVLRREILVGKGGFIQRIIVIAA